MTKYLVYYNQPQGVVYWLAPMMGTTCDINLAHHYTQDEVEKYVFNCLEMGFVDIMEV